MGRSGRRTWRQDPDGDWWSGVRVGADKDVELTDQLDGDARLPEAFGSAWPSVHRFHRLLVDEGPVRGLIGPRETGRLWERHLLN